MDKLSRFYQRTVVRWVVHTTFYLAILLILFFLYSFHSANTGSYIYNDF